MPSTSLISCVIPVYNGQRFLAEAIESVLAQSLSLAPLRGGGKFEIIVVDDGSTDGTRDVARSFAGHVVYVHQQNAGAPTARNRGIGLATGEFVALLDSDDLWQPDKTAVQLARFDARPELAICTASMQNFWTKEVEHEIANLTDGRLTEVQPNLGSSFIARRPVFQTLGLLDTNLRHRDIQELILRATDSGLVVEALPDVLVKRRIHDANVSRHRTDDGDRELIAIARARIARRRPPST